MSRAIHILTALALALVLTACGVVSEAPEEMPQDISGKGDEMLKYAPPSQSCNSLLRDWDNAYKSCVSDVFTYREALVTEQMMVEMLREKLRSLCGDWPSEQKPAVCSSGH